MYATCRYVRFHALNETVALAKILYEMQMLGGKHGREKKRDRDKALDMKKEQWAMGPHHANATKRVQNGESGPGLGRPRTTVRRMGRGMGRVWQR